MSDIVVSGYYGFANAGDEAMLAAMIEALTDIEPNIKITVISGNPEDTRHRHGVAAVYRLNYPEIAKVLAQSQLLISGGGSLLQDVTSDRSLYYYLSIMMLAKKLGKPVMLYAQGIGPVRGALAQGAMRYIGNMVDLITVRDEGSYEELKRLKVTAPPVHITADPVLAMHPVDKAIGRSILKQYGQEGVAPLIGISVREWKDWGHFKQVMGHAADKMIEELGAKVVFIPMQWPDDLDVSEKIAGRMKNKASVLPSEYTTSELLSLVGNLDLLIGIRLHALIFAAVMHVPMAGISYDPKIDRFLETIGEKHVGTLKTVTADNLMVRIREMWDERKQPNREREDRITILRNKAFLNAELALSLIKK
ncbi:colanic acid biosynthesis protein [Sporomusa ovata DSM 2662]|uniref:Polysaccharide pyruvyl transferase n=1 Tax=Sporomusa ovata TaxID=2378 RepID=A0A0U1KUM7_9FIRM|nr:polysaccharide pyruvyl transferase CsaB [Sporomusa ovata]EQB26328.1 polysaccharide pyruvyl transferase [Sporomusa ovata DSM 2662]CQR70404.1 polysaccharide pyruvyl transferase [Sporomusa ovata]